MNDETERIYKELLKQYADAFTQAGKDGSEENVRRLQVTRDLAADLLQVKYSKKRVLSLLDATAYLWQHCQRLGAGTNCEGCKACAIIDWCIGLGPDKCPGNLITGEGEDGE